VSVREVAVMSVLAGAPREDLAAHECWALLRASEVGRLATCVGARPEIFPVNFVVDGGSIVFRTGEGSKVAAITHAPDVAFEADGYDAATGQAWSVVAHGRAVDIPTSEAFEALALPLFPWHVGPKHRIVQIAPYLISGRRFRVSDTARSGAEHTTTRPAPVE
jgi:hypothetical protein